MSELHAVSAMIVEVRNGACTVIDSIGDLLETLAQDIRRSVAVDDASLRLLGYSTHFEDADPARLGSLVGRRVTGPLREYVMSHRIQSWTEPHTLPAMGEYGLEHDRIGFPLRSRYELLGIMWVLSDSALTDEEREKCMATARDVERLLARRLQSQLEADVESESLIFALLSSTEADRLSAARDLQDLGLFTAVTDVCAIVMTVDTRATPLPDEELADTLRRAMTRATQPRLRNAAVTAVTTGEGIALIGVGAHQLPDAHRETAERMLTELRRLEPALADVARIGIGSTAPLTRSAQSYDQAVTAVEVSRHRDRPIASWDDYPLEALLAAALRPLIDGALLPPVLTDGVAAQSASTLAVLAEFLDSGGNVAATAESLHLHRTTVYYRLGQFEKATGLNLQDGRTRLMLHLWLVARDRIGGA